MRDGADGRRHVRDGADGRRPRWVMDPSVEVFDVRGLALHHRLTVEGPSVCQANGIVGVASDRFYVSNDAKACSATGKWLELAAGLDRSYVVRVVLGAAGTAPEVVPVVRRVRFANGLAADDEHLYVAATRAGAILAFRRDRLRDHRDQGATDTPDAVFRLGTGPDNLTGDGAGGLLAASHPSLFRLALYRHRWWPGATAPSHVVRVDPRDGSVGEVYRSREQSSGRGLFLPCVDFWQDLKKTKDENRKSYCILCLFHDEIIIYK